jgi:CBS domain-containing protein
METNPLTADPHMDIQTLRKSMLDRHARYIPVMEAGTLLGVLSFHDVAKAVYEEQSFENKMLKSYIKNWPDEEEAASNS